MSVRWSYIPICFLLWSFHSNSAAVLNTGSFKRPSSNSDARISAIQSNLLKVQGEMLILNSALQSGDSSSDLKARLSTLEGEFQSLKEQLLNERVTNTAANGKYDSSINVLTNYYNTLDTQLKALQRSMEDRASVEASRQLPADIVEHIRSHRFSAAEDLIMKMRPYETKIPKIVSDVYANSQANTDLLVDFVKAAKYIDLSFYVLRALRYEMQANGHRDPYKMIALAKALESEVINRNNVSSDLKAKAEEVLDKTIAEIKTVATEILKAAMYADNYQKNVQVETLANAIYFFRSQVSDEVMQQLVRESLISDISAVKIADDIYSNTHIPQIVAGLVALYKGLESSNDMTNVGLLRIRHYLVKLQGMPNYRNLSDEKKSYVNSILEKIPDCSKYVIYPPKICGPGIEEPLSYLPIVGLPFMIGSLFT